MYTEPFESVLWAGVLVGPVAELLAVTDAEEVGAVEEEDNARGDEEVGVSEEDDTGKEEEEIGSWHWSVSALGRRGC